MKKNSLPGLPFPQARPKKGEQGVEGTWGCVSTEAELMVPTWRASASAWGRGTPHLTALPQQIPLPRKSDHISLLLVAVANPELPICTQNVIFIIILNKFIIATVQRAIQLPAFSLILGHRQNTPGMN